MDATGAGPRAPMPRPGGARPQDAAPFPGADRVDPAQVFRADGYTSPPASSNGLASVALWLSAFFLFLPPLLLVSGALGGIAWVLSLIHI